MSVFKMLDLKMVFGYTTRRHLLLDLDSKTFKQAVFIAKSITDTYDLGDCLILLSSQKKEEFGIRYVQNEVQVYHIRPHSWHLVFDKFKSWNYLQKVVYDLADLGIVEESFKEVREWRGDLTLRISPKLPKVSYMPIPVAYIYADDDYTMRGYYGIMTYAMHLANFAQFLYEREGSLYAYSILNKIYYLKYIGLNLNIKKHLLTQVAQ